MKFRDSAQARINLACHVGIAIKVSDRPSRQLHVGILYRRQEGPIHFAHLARHEACFDEEARNDRGYFWEDSAWYTAPGMEGAAIALAAYIRSCASESAIPYSPIVGAARFDELGRYENGGPLEGLTCASYVHTVLKSGGFDAVEIGTWGPRLDDATWWSNLIPYLGPRGDELRDLTLPYRLRPDEIAVACVSGDAPLNFSQAVAQGAILTNQLLP